MVSGCIGAQPPNRLLGLLTSLVLQNVLNWGQTAETVSHLQGVTSESLLHIISENMVTQIKDES